MRIRDLTQDDVPFLRDMLYVAAFWRPDGDLPPKETALSDPTLATYHQGWGRQGDTGFVAETEGRLIGAAWYRLFTNDAHGYGYVDEQTPEVSLAVLDTERRKGVGRALMEAITHRARGDGIAHLALSVNKDNPAKHLYASLGYVDISPDDPNGRMLLDLC